MLKLVYERWFDSSDWKLSESKGRAKGEKMIRLNDDFIRLIWEIKEKSRSSSVGLKPFDSLRKKLRHWFNSKVVGKPTERISPSEFHQRISFDFCRTTMELKEKVFSRLSIWKNPFGVFYFSTRVWWRKVCRRFARRSTTKRRYHWSIVSMDMAHNHWPICWSLALPRMGGKSSKGIISKVYNVENVNTENWNYEADEIYEGWTYM